jgi:hypothetical protein
VLHLDAANKKSYPGSGTVWYDLSGNGKNGTLTNGPTFSSDNGGSIAFDETNDYVSVSNFGIQSHSICAFVRTNKLNDFQGIFGQANDIWNNLSVALRIKNNNAINYVLSGSGTSSGNYSEYETNFQLSANTWYYVCSTFDRPNRNIYLNGIEQQCFVAFGTQTVDYDLYNSISNIIIGGYAYSNAGGGGGLNYLLNGNISCLNLYNRALTAAEVQQNFNALRGRYGI